MVTIILFAPLVGAILAGFGWKLMGEKGAQWTTTGLLFLAALLSWIVFLTLGDAHTVSLFRFIESGTLSTAVSRSLRVVNMKYQPALLLLLPFASAMLRE